MEGFSGKALMRNGWPTDMRKTLHNPPNPPKPSGTGVVTTNPALMSTTNHAPRSARFRATNPGESGQAPVRVYAASREPPRVRHRAARGDPSASSERVVRPRLIDPDHLLAGRALEPAADHARHADIVHDTARFELNLLDRVVGVTIAPARKLVGVGHRFITVGRRSIWRKLANSSAGPGALFRGGDFTLGTGAGVFAINGLNNPFLDVHSTIGFRAAR